tara:strand:- start:2022 stop:2522 length:501 start_codon:yes stop_codon:yes gene_type:complete
MAKAPKIVVTGGEKELQAITKELGYLGNPKWVLARYGAAVRHAMKPVLAAAKGFVPTKSHNLQNSLIITGRRIKGKMITEARVGVNTDAIFLNKNPGGGLDASVAKNPIVYVASVEFGNKNGMMAQPFLRPAYLITGQPQHIIPRVQDFLKKAIVKRTNFLSKGVK